MKRLNLRRNKRRRKKKVAPRTGQPSFQRRRGRKHLKRKVKGTVRTFFWKMFSSFKVSFIILLSIFTVIAFGVYWIVKNRYFEIKKYEIVGNELLSEQLILNSVSKSSGKWIFFCSPPSLESSVRGVSNYVKSVYVEKKLPDTLVIHTQERNPLAVWRTVNGAYLIDEEGYVLERSVAEDVALDKVLSDVTMSKEQPIEEEGEDLVVSDEDSDDLDDDKMSEDENEEDGEDGEEQKVVLEEILDEELLSQIEMDKRSRGNEQSLLSLDFDMYNNLPDSFKKYPQVKLLSDDVYEINSTISWDIWGGYSTLLSSLKERNGFSPKEILIFSRTKVLVLLENDKRVYFRLDEEVREQVRLLEFVYGRLMVESIEFQEIDLRFKRPVIRKR